MSRHASLKADLHTSVELGGSKPSLLLATLLCMLPQYMCKDLQYSRLQVMASKNQCHKDYVMRY